MKSKGKVSGKALHARLEAHPEWMARVERILDLVENTERNVFRAVDAEECAIQEIMALGQEVLQDWAKRLAAEANVARTGETRGKKTALLAQQPWRNRSSGNLPSRLPRSSAAALFRFGGDSLSRLFPAAATSHRGFCGGYSLCGDIGKAPGT
ncbi:MAG: hypothetical protein LBF93_06835 [Zoogloeaceae bacterium]|jgi:hypothetical protein|nr:hypothetical protein [Zoogloeaceae bacterium]